MRRVPMEGIGVFNDDEVRGYCYRLLNEGGLGKLCRNCAERACWSRVSSSERKLKV